VCTTNEHRQVMQFKNVFNYNIHSCTSYIMTVYIIVQSSYLFVQYFQSLDERNAKSPFNYTRLGRGVGQWFQLLIFIEYFSNKQMAIIIMIFCVPNMSSELRRCTSAKNNLKIIVVQLFKCIQYNCMYTLYTISLVTVAKKWMQFNSTNTNSLSSRRSVRHLQAFMWPSIKLNNAIRMQKQNCVIFRFRINVWWFLAPSVHPYLFG